MEKEKFVSLSQTQLGIYLDCVEEGRVRIIVISFILWTTTST